MSDSRPPIDKSMLRDSIVDWIQHAHAFEIK